MKIRMEDGSQVSVYGVRVENEDKLKSALNFCHPLSSISIPHLGCNISYIPVQQRHPRFPCQGRVLL